MSAVTTLHVRSRMGLAGWVLAAPPSPGDPIGGAYPMSWRTCPDWWGRSIDRIGQLQVPVSSTYRNFYSSERRASTLTRIVWQAVRECVCDTVKLNDFRSHTIYFKGNLRPIYRHTKEESSCRLCRQAHQPLLFAHPCLLRGPARLSCSSLILYSIISTSSVRTGGAATAGLSTWAVPLIPAPFCAGLPPPK